MQVLIDLNQACLEMEVDELEAYSLQLAEELRGDLAEEASLVQEDNVPKSAMAGGAAFIWGILQAEINAENLGKVMDGFGICVPRPCSS